MHIQFLFLNNNFNDDFGIVTYNALPCSFVSQFTPAALATDSTAKLLRAALPQLMQISFGKFANVL